MINKYQKTKNSTILIPSDPQKAALVDQFISVGISYFIDPVTKLIRELNAKNMGATTNLEIVKEAREEISNIFDIYEKYWRVKII